MKSKLTITLYVMSWNGYWDKYGAQWIQHVNNFRTQPDEIVIVSDSKIDASTLTQSNVKNIIVPTDKYFNPVGNYRNIAIKNSSSDWIVASDLDDVQLVNYLDDLDPSADICGFSFIEKEHNKLYTPNSESLNKRLLDIYDDFLIPGTSAIKKVVFDKIRYEDSGYEDMVFYAKASKLNFKVVNVNPTEPRFIYSGFHSNFNNKEVMRISKIYTKVLMGNRNIYCFWFSKEVTENRKKAFDILCKNSKCNIVLINSETFYTYENLEIPIHKGFPYLSDVHKSDYARAYMMYFYGEGYTDIKPNSFDWFPYFDMLFTSRHDVIGAKTENFYDSGNFWNDDEYINNIMLKDYSKLISMGHFIFKPKTKLAYKWLELIHKKMDDKLEQLIANPSKHPYSVKGGIHAWYEGHVAPEQINPDYPFEWAELGGVSLHQIQYESGMQDQLLIMPKSNTVNYR